MKPNLDINFRTKTTMPIRDMDDNGRIFCLVDIYGWTGRDVCIIPGGSDPMLRAVRRLGLDPERYKPVMWDVQL
jgi:hypothetical protein